MTEPRVLIVTEVRVYSVKESYYADASFAKIIERYSKYFGKIILATRIIEEKKLRDGFINIDCYCSKFRDIGSLMTFLMKGPSAEIIEDIGDSNCVVLRLPSVACVKIYKYLKAKRKKYITEVMGCAWDAYWNHGVVGKIIAPFMFFKTKHIVRKADYCVYVTQRFLQTRYPCDGKCVGISNVDIRSVDSPKKYDIFDDKNFTMMTAAALNVRYKGQQYVIKAISELKQKYNINVKYYLAGKGDNVWLKNIAKKYGVENNMVFLGMLPKEELHKYMREVDIYIQPSLQEGLPRSLIEAMSCGMVCFGSNIAGIPELLDERRLFRKKSAKSIIDTIINTVSNDNLRFISEQNINISRLYKSTVLDEKRRKFFKQIKRGIR